MQFVQDNEWLKIARITGPAHNLLGLVFGDHDGTDVSVQCLPSTNSDEPRRLDLQEVKEQVLAGVGDANRRYGTTYVVAKIQFLPTDSPPSSIYKQLAALIVERLAKKGAFKQI